MALEIKPLSPLMHFTDEDVKEVLKRYNRTLETAREDVEVIKTWMKAQKHLPVMESERQIFHFLVHNKFFVELTKQKIDMFFTIRGLIPEFYEGRVPSSKEMMKIRELICTVPLPKLTKDKNRIWVYSIINPNDPQFSSCTLFSFFINLLELRSLVDFSSSYEYICDMSNATPTMFAKYNPLDIKKLMTIVDKVYSNRLAALHFIGLPSYGEAMMSLFMTFAKEKLKKRFFMHKNMDALQNLYPKSLLPKDFGGELASIEELRRDYLQLLDDNEDYFQRMQNVKVNESLREKKLEGDDILGFHGNFKKLAVD